MHMAYKGFDLTGKVALVTGGNGGIGFGMADAMAEAGADVCIWGTRKEKTDAAGEKLKRHGRKVHWVPGALLKALNYIGGALPFVSKPTMKLVDSRRKAS